MTNEQIMVSICCITYNHEKYIEKTLKGFLMQEIDFKYEILIHDDASTDRTQEIIKKYQRKYPEIIKPIYQKENQYSQGKRVSNIIYSKARGKYIALCEGDDFWIDCHKLQKQFDYMEEYPKTSMCTHQVLTLDEKSNKIKGSISPSKQSRKLTAAEIIEGGGGFLGTNSLFIKSEIIKKLPPFCNECVVGDYPLQIMAALNGEVYYMNEPMSIYRRNVPGSWTVINTKADKSKKIFRMNNLIDMLNKFDEYSKNEYSNSIQKMIKKIIFERLIEEGKIETLKSKEYYEIYKKLNLLQKIKIYLKCDLPRLFGLLKKIKQMVE